MIKIISKPINPKKFTPLEKEKIADILKDSPELCEVSRILGGRVRELIEGEFAFLREADLAQNMQGVMDFLHAAGLAGEDDEVGAEFNHKNRNVNAIGYMILNAYLRNKGRNKDANVEVLTYLDEPYPTFHENFVSKAIVSAVKRDFSQIYSQDEFSKSYVVVAGVDGSHVTTLSIKKEKGSVEPVVELFDPSPKMIRNGLAIVQNLSRLRVFEPFVWAASMKEAFDETGYKLTNDNFFHNSEPFQSAGPNYCGTYAIEEAYNIARQSPEERIKYLREVYKYDSIFGGKTEIDISLEEAKEDSLSLEIGQKSRLGADSDRTFKGDVAAMSHFNSALVTGSRGGFLHRAKHQRKDGEIESLLDRLERYIEGNRNEMAQEKSMRQRLHIFEIVTSEEFLGLEKGAGFNGSEVSEGIVKRRREFLDKYEEKPEESQVKLKKEVYFKVFAKYFSLPFDVEYNEQDDCMNLGYRLGDLAISRLKSVIEKDHELRKNCKFLRQEVGNVEGDFGEVKVDKS